MSDDREEKIQFLMALARALHSYGTPAHRLEEALGSLAESLAVPAQFLCTPTSIVFAHGRGTQQQTYLVRVEPGQEDLGKLRELHETIRAVYRGELSPDAGRLRIEEIDARPPRYRRWLTALAITAVSGSSVVMFQGGWRELIVASANGLMLALLYVAGEKRPRFAQAVPVLAAFGASLLASVMDRFVGPSFAFLGVLAGLITLLPGLTLTIAMNELAHRHLVSGTARLVGALVTFLQLGVGIGVGTHVAEWLFGQPAGSAGLSLPSWTLAPALLVTSLSLVVLFRARPRDLPLVLLTAGLAYFGARAGTHWLGPELGVAVGAWLVGVASNLSARWLDQPTAIGLVPGLLLLVPGSLGLRSLQALMARDVLGGVEGGFTVFLIAISLVTGLFLANLSVASRRLL